MGLFSFIKGAGAKLFGKQEEKAREEEKAVLRASVLLAHVQGLALPFKSLTVSVKEGVVTLTGAVEKQEDAENRTKPWNLLCKSRPIVKVNVFIMVFYHAYHSKCTYVHNGVNEHVENYSIHSTMGWPCCNRQHDVTGVGNTGVGQHPLQVGLLRSNNVTIEHGQHT